jgi:hypothetical protein
VEIALGGIRFEVEHRNPSGGGPIEGYDAERVAARSASIFQQAATGTSILRRRFITRFAPGRLAR